MGYGCKTEPIVTTEWWGSLGVLIYQTKHLWQYFLEFYILFPEKDNWTLKFYGKAPLFLFLTNQKDRKKELLVQSGHEHFFE